MTTPAKPEPPSALAVHGVLTVGGALAIALGEAAGNLLFRRGTIRISDLGDELVIGAILGNVVAFLLLRSRRSA
jgi:hypothetical protein